MTTLHTAERPHPAPIRPETIPDALKAIPSWVVWKYVQDVDPETGEINWDKPPFNARTNGLASSTNAKTWSNFPTALAAYLRGGLDGVGFVLHRKKGADDREASGGLVGVDLDDCRDLTTGEIADWAKQIIRTLNTYCEVSPSGAGVRLFLYGDLPPKGRKKGDYENYQSGRYVTVTGHRVEGTPLTIEHRQAELEQVHASIFVKKKEEFRANGGGKIPSNLDDAEIVRRACGSRKIGDKFSRLWNGETAGYGSASEADLALCNYLAFWCGPDEGRIAEMFAQSGLYRSKWNRPDYRERTIAKALDGKTEFYTPGWDVRTGTNGNSHAGSGTNGASASGSQEDGQPQRLEVFITANEKHVNDAVAGALANSPHLFQRGYQLVGVVRPTPRKSRIERPAGSPVIVPLPPSRLREEMTDVVAFMKWKEARNGELTTVHTHPPDWCVPAVHGRGSWPGVRQLEAVIETPALRPDGTVLDRPGYDTETGLLYEPGASFPAIPERPGLSDAIQASQRLLELVADFPFLKETHDAHRAAWLSALLTPFARFAVSGPSPLFLMESGTPGTGKSLLCDVIAILATGRQMARTSFPSRDEELHKVITAIAIAGDRLALFDNISGPFGGAALDAALTGTSWKGRILGRSEMTAELPLNTIWFGSGNNITLRGDVRRRALPCRIEALDEKPEERQGFQIPRLLEHVTMHRGRLVADCLTVLRAYEVAGRPGRGLPPLGSFEAWSDLVRSAVHWVRGIDCCETREGLKAADSAATDLAALLRGWAELPGGKSGARAREAIKEVRDTLAQYETLREVFRGWAHKGETLPSAKTVGRRLMAFRGRVMARQVLKAAPDREGVLVWSVVAT